MQVLKFGGSSVANATNISRVLDIAEEAVSRDRTVLVCSAISGCTDALIKIGESSGEEKSALMAELFSRHIAIARRLFTGQQRTDCETELAAMFEDLAKARPQDCVCFGELFLTRIVAHKLTCEDGKVFWLDSRDLVKVRDGKLDEDTTYANIRSAVGCRGNVDLFVAPGFIGSDENGFICNLGRGGSDYSAAIYASALDASVVEIWTDVPGIMTANPKDVSAAKTVSEMSYAAARSMAERGAKVLYAPTVAPAMAKSIPINIRNTFDPRHPGTMIENLKEAAGWIGVAVDKEKISIVSDGPFDEAAAEKRVVRCLKKARIAVCDITPDRDALCVKVSDNVRDEAVRALHAEFFEDENVGVCRVYIAGTGAVGSALKAIIDRQPVRSGRQIFIKGFSSDHNFAEKVAEEAEKGSVFVDCTNSESIYKYYVPLLDAGVNIVSSNRRALSVPYAHYEAMKAASRHGGAYLRYETTVGTALPMLAAVASCAQASDEITSMEAVVSCTLNYILSSGLPFGEALANAQKAGLTEKDPSQDLCGRDALRKLLILSREAGVPIEEEDVHIEPVEESAVKENCRFVAMLEKDASLPLGYRASIKLREVDKSHPAYWLKGTDNAIIIRSAIHTSPLIIQGAGEGAQAAASGILNDILR